MPRPAPLADALIGQWHMALAAARYNGRFRRGTFKTVMFIAEISTRLPEQRGLPWREPGRGAVGTYRMSPQKISMFRSCGLVRTTIE